MSDTKVYLLDGGTLVIDGDADKQKSMEQRQVAAINNGSMIVTGDLGKVPPCLANVHDAMARLTAV